MKILSALAFAAVVSQGQATDNQIQGSPFLTVGDGNTCDFSSIQAAIDSTLSNTIRIASDKAYLESITIDDRSMVLTGGYANCTDAANNITNLSKAVISGNDSGTVITITGNDQIRDLELRHMAIGNADVGLQSTADANIDVDNVVIMNNNDAGVLLFGGDNNLTMDNVLIFDNDGTAVACLGANNVVVIQGDSEIKGNESVGVGGGLAIASECKANVYAPTEITENKAVSHGGGIYVEGGALVNLHGIEVTFNEADSDTDNDGLGGGLFVKDAMSIVNAINVTFVGNSAYSGGAVAAQDNGVYTSYSANTLSNPCQNTGKCSQYMGNSAQARGGVLFATTEGRIKVLHANITGNGLLDHGLVAHASNDGEIEIEGSMVVKNGGEDLPGSSLFNVNGIIGDPSIKLNHVTIAANHVSSSVVRNNSGHFSMSASIVQDDVDVSSEINSTSHSFECVIAHETGSFSAGGTVTVNDPQFINPAANDFHLKPTSPAIDYCYDAEPLTVELGYDIDFENRNYDDPNVTDLHGQYDIGADEYRWDNDLIFMHGFEQD
jgi:predicted outer membrane repeat protein